MRIKKQKKLAIQIEMDKDAPRNVGEIPLRIRRKHYVCLINAFL